MNAEFLATGSELLGPRKTESNSLFLAGRLRRLGISLTRKAVVGDDRKAIARAVAESVRRMNAASSSSGGRLLVVCGGLGPTRDDVTVEAAARALRKKLVLSRKALAWIEKKVVKTRRGAPNLRKQAFAPRGFEVLRNPYGTAPGLWGRAGRVVVVLLPGVPCEFRALCTREVEPRLRRLFPKGKRAPEKTLHVAGMLEADMDAMLEKIPVEPEVRVGDTAHSGTISVHLEAEAATEREARAALRRQARRYRGALGSAVFGEDGDTLEGIVGKLCKKRKVTLAVAESCTGGLLSERITSVAGSSAYFLGGVVAYTGREKERLLGVAKKTLRDHGSVSEPTARAMARGARRRFGADYALSATGIAGPGGGTRKKPRGTVCMAIAWKGGVRSWTSRFPGDRAAVRSRTAALCLNALRLALERRRG
ncbi:MAG: CinA family nicotinamide mononucleotide deamidase-related protein [Acidobacteriota bacterium]|nr:MAG: CinA family nicotinamide mononucleotide deamidase-related protein [Acidobacteriota bacterium]